MSLNTLTRRIVGGALAARRQLASRRKHRDGLAIDRDVGPVGLHAAESRRALQPAARVMAMHERRFMEDRQLRAADRDLEHEHPVIAQRELLTVRDVGDEGAAEQEGGVVREGNLAELLRDGDLKARLEQQALMIDASGPQALAKTIEADFASWRSFSREMSESERRRARGMAVRLDMPRTLRLTGRSLRD